jgi:hypothetical protein
MARSNRHKPTKYQFGLNEINYVGMFVVGNLREVSKRCSLLQERGRGNGRSRRTEITFGRVEIWSGDLSGQADVCQEKRMKVFKVSAASGRRREG